VPLVPVVLVLDVVVPLVVVLLVVVLLVEPVVDDVDEDVDEVELVVPVVVDDVVAPEVDPALLALPELECPLVPVVEPELLPELAGLTVAVLHADNANAATKTETLIHEPDEKEHDYYMSSDTRTTAAVLLGLVELDPKNTAIKPLVATLMKARRATRYWDTHANFYSLLALTTYAKAFAGSSPSVAIQIAGKDVLSATLAGKQKLRILTVPFAVDTEVQIAPKGEVACNVAVRYRARPETIKAESHGLEITREYTDEAGKAKTSFRVGDVVVVKLHVKLPEASTHLMVSDALPAGFEALNTKLATVGADTVKEKQIWWDEDREIHDDRVDFASEYVYESSLDYEYSIRAIASGKFARPPARAELMYDPKQNANTALDVLEVVAK